MKNLIVKFYNKQSRVVFQSWHLRGYRRHVWFNLNMSYDPETDGIGLHFYLHHEDDQSMNDNPGRSGFLYRTYYNEPKFVNRTFGQGTDLSELYYTRPE
ncbi:hypothetical protein Q1695_006969 [Nippostrongylus brasiliensis]|nr:hypothetical protein Q1695_006969 [Nippostrongylus brasiliensis]